MPKTFEKPFILRSAQKKRAAPADGSDSDHSETCSPSKRSAQKKRAAPPDGSDSNHSETRSPSKRPRKFILPPAAARDLLQPVDDEAPLPTAEEYPASVVIHGRVYYAFGSLPLQPGAGAPLTRSALPRSFAVGGSGNLESLPGGPKAGNHSEPASDHESSDSFHSRELEYPANSSSPLHHRSPIDTGSSVLTRDPPVLSSPSPPLPSNPLDGWTPSRHSTSFAKDSSLSSRKGSRSSSSVALKMHSHAAFPLQPDTTASSPSPPQSLLSSPAYLKAGSSPANTSPMGSSSLCPSSSPQEKKRLRAPKLPVALSGRPLRDQLISQALSHSPTVVGSSAVSGPTINIGNLDFVPATGTVLRRTGPSQPFISNDLGSAGCLNVDWIDARLRASYRSVTNLASVLIRPSSDETPTDDEDYLLYDDMVSALSASLELSIRGVVNFTHFGNFFNPARFNPAAITHARSSNKKHLVLENDRFFNAVFLAVGRQEKSYICKPKTFLLHNKPPRHIRGVRIHSLQQESQTMFAFFGSLFGCSSFGCAVSEGIVDFQSCQQFESEVSKNNRNDLSPLKPVSPTKRNPSKISDRPKNHFFKDPLPFSNAVPIFDGRNPAFSASPAELNQIGTRSYPLYMDGQSDLPDGSVVCIGFTVHTYESPPSYKGPSTSLSLGLQFLVLLALPPHLETHSPIRPRPIPRSVSHLSTSLGHGATDSHAVHRPSRSNPMVGQSGYTNAEPGPSCSHSTRSDDYIPYHSEGELESGYAFHEDL